MNQTMNLKKETADHKKQLALVIDLNVCVV
jgi:hypothetical protein